MNATILFIISTMNYGGAQKMLSFLANSLNDLGYRIYIYTYFGDKCHYLLDAKITYIPEKKIYKNYISKKIIPLFRVRNTIKTVKPDMVISFLNNANFLSVVGTLFTSIPLIISERCDPYNEKSFSLSIMRSVYLFAQGAVFQTEQAKAYYNKIIQKKCNVIPNPVTIEYKVPMTYKERNNEIAFVARFNIKQKRQDIMVKAFKKVVERKKNVRLVFYGDGGDMPAIKDMVTKYNLTDYVVFAGKVDDVQSHIEKAKLFVLTSDYEGIPNALLEAMSIGLPVVATDCSPGGARLLIENNKNGILVPAGDIDAVAEGIIFLLENPKIAEQYGIDAQKVLHKYSPQRIISLWTNYIERIMG